MRPDGASRRTKNLPAQSKSLPSLVLFRQGDFLAKVKEVKP